MIFGLQAIIIRPMKHILPFQIIRKRTLILFCCLLPVAGCHSQKEVVVAKQIATKSNTLELKGNSEIKQGSTVNFELINNSAVPITVFGPWQKRIEKFEDGSWRRVKIISCPCGADCNAPPRTLILNPTEKHSYDWNLREGWCGKVQGNGIPQTIENISAIGLYRLSVDYSLDGTSRLTLTKEFNIIK